MFGDLSAGTNGLDPGCTDEAAASRFRWIATVRIGVEETKGDVGVFVSGGPALAEIVNSVTDPDYSGSTCLETDLRLDADDSFRRGSTEVGWAIGAGFELPLAARWALRFVSGLRQRDLSREPVRQQFMQTRRCHGGLPLHRQEQAGRGPPRDRLPVLRIGYAGVGGCGAVHGVQVCSEARNGIPTTNAVSEGPSIEKTAYAHGSGSINML